MLFGPLRPNVDQVGPYTFGLSAVAAFAGRVGGGRAVEPVFGLSPRVLPLPKAPREIHTGHEVMRHVADEAGLIAGLCQGFGDGAFILRHRLPPGQIDVVPRHGLVPVKGIGPAPRVQRPAGGDGRQAFGVSPAKQHALSREALEIRGFHPVIAVHAHVRRSERVGHDDDDVPLPRRDRPGNRTHIGAHLLSSIPRRGAAVPPSTALRLSSGRFRASKWRR